MSQKITVVTYIREAIGINKYMFYIFIQNKDPKTVTRN
jgi:hypothetical protein